MTKVTHTALGTPYPKGVGPSKERQYNIDAYKKAARSKALEGKKKEIASKMKDKGKESLNIPKGEKNEGNKMQEGRNENNRA